MLMVVTNVLGGKYWWAGILMERRSRWFWLLGRGEGNSRVKVLKTEEQETVKQTSRNEQSEQILASKRFRLTHKHNIQVWLTIWTSGHSLNSVVMMIRTRCVDCWWGTGESRFRWSWNSRLALVARQPERDTFRNVTQDTKSNQTGKTGSREWVCDIYFEKVKYLWLHYCISHIVFLQFSRYKALKKSARKSSSAIIEFSKSVCLFGLDIYSEPKLICRPDLNLPGAGFGGVPHVNHGSIQIETHCAFF